MEYPGHIVKIGEPDHAVVAALITQLGKLGYTSDRLTGAFDEALKSLIKTFQSQHVDKFGQPLLADGKVGPLSWGALFGAKPVAVAPAGGGIAGAALAVAISQIGIMEKPPGSNKGPEVEGYLKSVGLGGGFFWCMAFVHWCFKQAADQKGIANPFPKTAGCIDAWNKTPSARRITKAQAIANPGLVRPGLVFILDHGGGAGHTGFVREAAGGALRTVEGNSNATGSANGVGVFDLTRRKVTAPDLRGFLDFTT